MTWAAHEEQIVDRLKDRLGDTVKAVYTTTEVAQVEESSQATPNVAVIFQGYTPVSSAGGAASIRLRIGSRRCNSDSLPGAVGGAIRTK